MDVFLGKGRFVTASPFRDADYRRTIATDPSVYGRRPRLIYLWDCRLEPAGNLPPPANVALDCVLTSARVGVDGRVDPADTAARRKQLLADTGLPSEERLTRTIEDQFPPQVLDLDLPLPDPMMTDRTRVHVVGWPDFSDLLITTGKPGAASYVLSIPRGLRLELLITGRCGGPAADGAPDAVGKGKRFRRNRIVGEPLFFTPPRLQDAVYVARLDSAGFWFDERQRDRAALDELEAAAEAALERQRQACRERLKRG